MPTNLKKIYICTKCDAQHLKWEGRCNECGAWGTLVEQVHNKEKPVLNLPQASAALIDLSTVPDESAQRTKSGIGELDRVLGGGLVPGSLLLLAGEPGIGKSTILAQAADALASASRKRTVYVSGEESAAQVKGRLDRLGAGLDNFLFVNETDVEKIIPAVNSAKPVLCVVDSIQTVYSSLIPSEAGSISQIRAATVKFLELAKTHNIAVILTGHITKDGLAAGPKSLEHIVDAVLYLESQAGSEYRLLRAVKNRFGSVNEIGVFTMTGRGFEEVKNPSSVFLDEAGAAASGSVISVVLEGTRPFLAEVQALASRTVFGYPQRKASGFDINRLQVLISVLTKRANVNLTNQDVIANVAGGLRVSDPALDLAVCLAIASSVLNQTIDRKTVVLGEVGLSGEIRPIPRLKERLTEAAKLGFERAIVPSLPSGANIKGLAVEIVKKLEDAISMLLK